MTQVDEIAEFRAQTRAWLEAHCPASMRSPPAPEEVFFGGGRPYPSEDAKLWFEAVREQRWLAPTWAPEYGGAGLSEAQNAILQEEMTRIGARVPIISLGLLMLGPTLLIYGTQEQKREHLPRIARGEIRWCQGFSEPGAGSDLASLATRCERMADHWLVNGQKVWTSFADQSDWIFILVRTDASSKHGGISMLLLDMKTAGVQVRPIQLISGISPFCETFFTDVKVPLGNIVGQPGEGWKIAKTLLSFERMNISRIAVKPVPLHELARRAGRLDDSDLRLRIAATEMSEEAHSLLVARARAMERAGLNPSSITSLFKISSVEARQGRAEAALEIMGADALASQAQSWIEMNSIAQDCFRSKAFSIEGGTTEINLGVIARSVLGLPDKPSQASPRSWHLPPEAETVVEIAAEFLTSQDPLRLRRELLTGVQPQAAAKQLWSGLVEMGWSGMLVPEEQGGLGLTSRAVGRLIADAGRQAAPLPVVGTALVGGHVLLQVGSGALHDRVAQALAAGAVLALALDENNRHAPQTVLTKLRNGRLQGNKRFVADANIADWLIVLAQENDEPVLCLVRADAPGVSRRALCAVDGQNVGDVDLEDVASEGLLARGAAVERLLDVARIGCAAEMAGLAAGAFALTLDYLKTRRQFGQLIGEFQVLQQRAARMTVGIELINSCVAAALDAMDRTDISAGELANAASLAKAFAGAVLMVVTNETIQMHGGMGVTHEHNAGLYLKRARVCEHLYGNTAFHRNRWAQTHGY